MTIRTSSVHELCMGARPVPGRSAPMGLRPWTTSLPLWPNRRAAAGDRPRSGNHQTPILWRCARPERESARAFTLVEVLIAIGLFFMVSFAVLEIVMVGLGAARSLQIRHADVGMLAAELAATNNILEEGTESGDYSDYFPGARWERNVEEVGSNGLFRVDFVVIQKVGKSENVSDISILLYRPGSPKGRMSGGTGRLTGPQPVQ